MINPLQHIPIISSLYQSITGDTIDPGAKIAGGTLFGGPLGAALSSLDVAVKHSTGRNIADHAVAFFISTTDDQNTPTPNGIDLKTASFETATLGNWSNRNQAQVSVLRPIETELIALSGEPKILRPPTTQISEDRFRAAGMSAIPVAKRPSDGDDQGATNMPRLPPDPRLPGDIPRSATPHDPIGAPKVTVSGELSLPALKNEGTKAGRNYLTPMEPHQLKPKFLPTEIPIALSETEQSQRLSWTPSVASLTPTVHPFNPIQAMNQTITDTENGWVADAMLSGLNKYEAAKSLAADSDRNPAVSGR